MPPPSKDLTTAFSVGDHNHTQQGNPTLQRTYNHVYPLVIETTLSSGNLQLGPKRKEQLGDTHIENKYPQMLQTHSLPLMPHKLG